MIIGELRCKYCGATLVNIDGDRTTIQNAIVQENYVFCTNCKNIIKSDILMSLFGLDTILTSRDEDLTIDKLYERMEEDEKELQKFEDLPRVVGEIIVKPVFSDHNKVYENCIFVVGQIRDSSYVMIRDSTLIIPASALLKCYPFVENCEHIALIDNELGILEQFVELPAFLKCLPFNETIFEKLKDVLDK